MKHGRHETAGALVVLVLFVGGMTTACCRPPERALRKGFEQHRAVLETIVRLSDEDRSVVRIAQDFTQLSDDASWPRPEEEWGFTEARWDRYRQLFKQAGIEDGISRSEQGQVYFLAQGCGLSISGRSSGYVYSPEEPRPLIQHLSELHSKGIGYVPLEGNWYLFADRD